MIPRDYRINKLSVIKMINIVKNKIPQCKIDATPPINKFPIFIDESIYKYSENNPS